ncbi:MAG: hypothetical protein K2I22_16910 [Lachnospiraceae bacterium]|nr:hypothetical protein [Lachnospiraceae bacterium]
MTKFFYKRKNGRTNHTTFGGVLYSSDFDTSNPRGNIAERIARDTRFDEQCKKNLSIR